MSLVDRRDGYYDADGNWQRTRYCFVACPPDKCTCKPPGGIWHKKQEGAMSQQVEQIASKEYTERRSALYSEEQKKYVKVFISRHGAADMTEDVLLAGTWGLPEDDKSVLDVQKSLALNGLKTVIVEVIRVGKITAFKVPQVEVEACTAKVFECPRCRELGRVTAEERKVWYNKLCGRCEEVYLRDFVPVEVD